MARLYPKCCPDGTNRGERMVFELLSELPDEYTVLHSVYLPYVKGYSDRQLDFVVISQVGILCLEVKGGYITLMRGQWVHINRYGEMHEGSRCPFYQARGAVGTLRHLVERRYPRSSLTKTLYAYGVMFPEATVPSSLPEQEAKIAYGAGVPPEAMEAYVSRVFKYQWVKLNGAAAQVKMLNEGEIARLVSMLRKYQRRPA